MIYLLLADGFEEIEALTPADVLRRAGLSLRTLSIKEGPVVGAHGIPVIADLLADEIGPDPIKLLILPGGMPGTKNLDASPVIDRLIEKTLTDGGRIAAICAAPMILGKRGLLAGREAVCYPGFEEHLDRAHIAEGKTVVTDGPFTTAIGMGAATAFATELLSLLTDKETAAKVTSAAFLPTAAGENA